jgi:hypothetical protein
MIRSGGNDCSIRSQVPNRDLVRSRYLNRHRVSVIAIDLKVGGHVGAPDTIKTRPRFTVLNGDSMDEVWCLANLGEDQFSIGCTQAAEFNFGSG